MTDNPNISETSIIAQRLINHYIHRVRGVKNIVITGGLLAQCTQACNICYILKRQMMKLNKGRNEH